jgi:catechol 2,3-dioxygenase-like lactoylglutathione lyase family enzyme
MLDHVGLNVADYAASRRFYEQALAPLGIEVVMANDEWKAAGFGSEGRPYFWVVEREPRGGSTHVAFHAADRATVDAFHAAALTAGGTDNGAPGIRAHYRPTYYAAFVIDPDGNNIEAVCHAPQ